MVQKSLARVLNGVAWIVVAAYLGGVFIHDTFVAFAAISAMALFLGVKLETLPIAQLRSRNFTALLSAFCGLFIVLPLLRHWAYGTWFWDFGAISQVIWRCANGLGPTSTAVLNDLDKPLAYFPNNHLNFWLFPLAGVYKILPHAEVFLVIQSVLFLVALLPLYFIGERIVPTVRPEYFLALFWFWNPLHKNNVWDIHETAFMPVFGLASYYFFLKRNWKLTVLCLIAMAAGKEDAWVVAGSMGTYFLINERKFKWAPLPFLAGFLIFCVHGLFFNKVNSFAQHYSFLGANLNDAEYVLLSRPWVLIGEVFKVDSLRYFFKLALSTGGLWLFSGSAVIPAVPTLLQHMISSNPSIRNLDNHYVIELAAPLFFATVVGAGNICKWWPDQSRRVLSVLFLVCLVQFRFSESYEIRSLLQSESWSSRSCFDRLLTDIPPDATVAAPNPLAGHLGARKNFIFYEAGKTHVLPGWLVFVPENELNLPPNILLKEDCGFKLIQITAK